MPTKSASVDQSMWYVGMGAGSLPIPLPVFLGGYRTQVGHFGADASLQVVTFGWDFGTFAKASCLMNFYPNPNPDSQWYLGVGIGPGVAYSYGYAAFLRFLQAQMSVPTFVAYHYHSRVMSFPLVVISYGFGF